MKYLQSGGFQSHPLMRLTLLWTAFLLTAFWLTNFFLYFSRMGLTPQSVADYYLGSEVLFTQPRSLPSMLEVTHMHLPMMALVLLLLTHLLIYAPMSHRVKVAFISASFLSAFFQEAAGWLVRFVHPGFAWLKIAAFLSLQSLLGYLLAALAMFLIRQQSMSDDHRPKRRDSHAHKKNPGLS